MSKEDILLFSCYGMRGEGKSYYEKMKEKDKEIERLHSIITEAREYIEERYNGEVLTHTFDKDNVGELLEILDKGSEKE